MSSEPSAAAYRQAAAIAVIALTRLAREDLAAEQKQAA